MRDDPYVNAPRLPEGEPVDLATIFSGSLGPCELEIGPGRGWFIVERLEADPSVNVLGLEIRRKWATIVDQRLEKRGLSKRARVFAEDARDALPRLPADCFRAVFVHFPDPWWKKRHQKRLVLGFQVVNEIARVLVPGGQLFIQTDVEERAIGYRELLAGCPLLLPAGSNGPALEDNPFDARSPRERKAIEDGLPVHRLLYRRPERPQV